MPSAAVRTVPEMGPALSTLTAGADVALPALTVIFTALRWSPIPPDLVTHCAPYEPRGSTHRL